MIEFDLSRLKHCGIDVRISDNAIIKYPELVSIGDHVAIDAFTYITTAAQIGSYVHIGPHCSIIGGREALCVLQDFTGLSAGSRLICVSDDYLGSGLTNPTVPIAYHAELTNAPIIIEKHAILGTGCIVYPGVTISEGAAVGSCSQVTHNLDPWYVYLGSPARKVKKRESAKILALEDALWRGMSTLAVDVRLPPDGEPDS